MQKAEVKKMLTGIRYVQMPLLTSNAVFDTTFCYITFGINIPFSEGSDGIKAKKSDDEDLYHWLKYPKSNLQIQQKAAS